MDGPLEPEEERVFTRGNSRKEKEQLAGREQHLNEEDLEDENESEEEGSGEEIEDEDDSD